MVRRRSTSNYAIRPTNSCTEATVSTNSKFRNLTERMLNRAILHLDLRHGCSQYLNLLDVFYADEIRVGIDGEPEVQCARTEVRGIAFRFLLPVYLIREIAGVDPIIEVRESLTEVSHIAYSDWSVRLTNEDRDSYIWNWSVKRYWYGQRVVAEHHFAHREEGNPLRLFRPQHGDSPAEYLVN
jgi:hypothetical protein